VFIVDENGDVLLEVEAIEATHPEFAVAAMEAVLDWKFDPGLKDGQPVNTKVRQTLEFAVSPSNWF
jgi:outer membrane biosynthesis protein TonB